jgi:lincosamide nucleotidyltransferase A/C/D/E
MATSAADVIHIYQLLSNHGIRVWLTGGWGIDALLGEQTRPHKDLDVLMLLDDVHQVFELFGQEGYILERLWEENRWGVDSEGRKTATAFVLKDPVGREFDAHAMRIDEQGDGLPAWDVVEGFIFTRQDLAGLGSIDGVAVTCISAESQMVCHDGYQLPDQQRHDLKRLGEKYAVVYPAAYFQQGDPE